MPFPRKPMGQLKALLCGMAWSPFLPLICCIILDKSLSLSKPLLFHQQNGNRMVPHQFADGHKTYGEKQQIHPSGYYTHPKLALPRGAQSQQVRLQEAQRLWFPMAEPTVSPWTWRAAWWSWAAHKEHTLPASFCSQFCQQGCSGLFGYSLSWVNWYKINLVFFGC